MSEQCAECAKRMKSDAHLLSRALSEIVQLRRSLHIAEQALKVSQELNVTLRERYDKVQEFVRKVAIMSVSEYERKEGEE